MNRYQTWLGLLVAAVLVIPAFVLGLWLYSSATAPVLHPDPQNVPSVMRSAPLPKWVNAAEQGRQIVRAALAEQNLPGISVAVGAGGEIVWAEGFGWADLENQKKVAPDTRFRIGTASVPLTSAAVGLLLEKQRLKLDDEIQTHVPAFPKKQWPVTLRQLMGHVAGVKNDGGDEGPLFSLHCERPVEGLQGFAEDSLLFEPGTQYRYSSYGWILMSAAVEAAADEPFMAFMRKEIFEPLGMNDTKAEFATGPTGGSGDVLLPEIRRGSRLWPAPDAPARLLLLRGIQRLPVHPVRPRALRDGDQRRQAAAARHGPITPDVTAAAPQGRRRVTALAGTWRPSRWPVNKPAWSDTTESCWAGWQRRS